MSQHQKLICGGLSVFLAVTHVGCAGSGLKNMFTRNETDGYHTLDELAADEEGYENETPSVTSRLASWRPFGKVEPDTEENYAADAVNASEEEATNAARNSILSGFTFSKRDNVAPDPFLGPEPKHPGLPASSASATADSKVAKNDDKLKNAGDEFAMERSSEKVLGTVADAKIEPAGKKPVSKDSDAVVSAASRKSDSDRSRIEDEDNLLAKRFEQHFLLNSVGTVAKQEADTTVTKVDAKTRDVAEIADRQFDSFNHLSAAAADPKLRDTEFRRNSAELKSANRIDSPTEHSANSLFAFDQLIGQEGESGTHEATQVAHTVTQSATPNETALDINVAEAEALFGAAAARQNARTRVADESVCSEFSGGTSARSSAWSESPDDLEGFLWNGSPSVETLRQGEGRASDASGAFARYAQSNAASGKQRSLHTDFGAPPVSAGNIDGDDCSVIETADIRLSNASTSAIDHQIITADYGTARPGIVVHPASTKVSGVGDARFTTAPVTPVPDQESSVEVGSKSMRPGLVQSLSIRNWLLLIGGIVVIALLFAPGRTKHLTMNS